MTFGNAFQADEESALANVAIKELEKYGCVAIIAVSEVLKNYNLATAGSLEDNETSRKRLSDKLRRLVKPTKKAISKREHEMQMKLEKGIRNCNS